MYIIVSMVYCACVVRWPAVLLVSGVSIFVWYNSDRIGEPEDIGGVIAFLCSNEASYITGETITVTGGMSCRL